MKSVSKIFRPVSILLLIITTLTSSVFVSHAADKPADSYFPDLVDGLNLFDLVDICSAPSEDAVGLNAVKSWLSQQFPQNLTEEDKGLLVAGLYLEAEDAIAKISNGLSLEKVYHAFTHPIDEGQLHRFDHSYFTQVLENTKSRMVTDAEFASNVHYISNDLAARSKSKPCTCTINGYPAPCWQCIVIVIVVIIIIVAA